MILFTWEFLSLFLKPYLRLKHFLPILFLENFTALFSKIYFGGLQSLCLFKNCRRKVFGVSSTWCFILEKYAIRLDPPQNSLGGLPTALPWGGPSFLAVAMECLSFLSWGPMSSLMWEKWQGQNQSSREQGRESLALA